MTIAVKFGDLTDPKQLSGFIFLDAVTVYTKTFGGRVTEHPIETGVSITDHFISENPKFKISGVISGVDLSPIPYLLKTLDTTENLSGAEAEKIKNINPPPVPVNISDIGAGLSRFLPDVISQFLPDTLGTVTGGDGPRQDFRQEVELFLETLMTGVFFNEDRKRWENRMTISTIYEVDGNQLGKSYTNTVMTQYNVTENVESGEGLFLELSFEQVRFATSEAAEAPAPQKGTPEARGAAPTKDKGTAKTTEVSSTDSAAPKGGAFSTDKKPGG